MSGLTPEARDIVTAGRAKDGPSAENRARVRARIAGATGAVFSSSAVATRAAASMSALGTTKAGTAALLAAKVGTGLVILGLAGGTMIMSRTVAVPAEAGSWRPNTVLSNTSGRKGSDIPRVVMAVPMAASGLVGQAPSSAPLAFTQTSATASLAAPAPDTVPSASAALPALSRAALPHAIRTQTNAQYGAGPNAMGSPPAASADESRAVESPIAAPGITPDNPSTPPSLAPSRIDAEVLFLRDAHSALLSGDPARALSLLQRHASEFPQGVLAAERDAERIVALCAVGRGDESRAEADRFLHDHPRSPLAPRVRTACELR
jgi:hypothetical protein